MAYDVNKLVTTGELKQAAQVFKMESDKAIKSLSVSGNTISFFTSEDGSGTAVGTVDFPKELFLDQTKTDFESNFAFTAQKFPGAVNPSLEGKPVLIFAVKGTTDASSGTASDTYSYSFIDVSALVDTYTVKAGDSTKVLSISGYEVEFKISPDADNAFEATANGAKVNITGKADKVASATADNLSALDANGNLVDSGIPKAMVLKKANVATSEEITEMLTEVFGGAGN